MKKPPLTTGAPVQLLNTDEWTVPRTPDQARCPLIRAAWRLGDPDVIAVVARVHPARYCPAARRSARSRAGGHR